MTRAILAAPVVLAVVVVLGQLLLQPEAKTAFAEIAVLTEENYDSLAPAGKEADAIYGDFVLRNDRLVAVVGNPVPGRDANSSVHRVGGAVIDLTLREHPRDLLSAFFPGNGAFDCRDPRIAASGEPAPGHTAAGKAARRGREVTFECHAPAEGSLPRVRLTYTLRAGEPFLTVRQVFSNLGSKPLEIPLEDLLRAEGPSFHRVPDGDVHLAWAYDPWFGQAYGVVGDGLVARVVSDSRSSTIRWLNNGRSSAIVPPAGRFVLTRRLFPAADTVAARAIEHGLEHQALHPVFLLVSDDAGEPVPDADVDISEGGLPYGKTRTMPDGRIRLELPDGAFHIQVSSLGRGSREVDLKPGALGSSGAETPTTAVRLSQAARVEGRITDDVGGPIPCQIMFTGLEGTPTPDFGPVVGTEEVKNLLYTPSGRFSKVVPPGLYEVTVSHGPEHDAVVRKIHVPPGPSRVPLEATLRRTVSTPGWISADFHGHSTASGDTAASTPGRVLNLAADQIEFAPCTEHNRLDTYAPHIQALGLTRFISSAVGLELTGEPFELNHQNAFPLRMRPRTQGNGAPPPDANPEVQIRRLAESDGPGERLVQQNHPDLGWMYYDRDGDGRRDGGFSGMFPYQEAVEVFSTKIHNMLPTIVKKRQEDPDGPATFIEVNNAHFNWYQLLNQGVRLPGVANTDAHHNFHGSGGQRNYVKCSTDAPDRIDPLEIARNAEKGHIIMTNGPYLEVSLTPVGGSSRAPAIPGDEIAVTTGRVKLHVRVQCPNWFDIDRVRVLLNGRLADNLSFTRYNDPRRFSDGVVKFDQTLEFDIPTDAHVIVEAAHLKSQLGPIMGPVWGQQPPVAISNPIFVDTNGDGFVANGDTLGHPLPVKGGRPVPAPAADLPASR